MGEKPKLKTGKEVNLNDTATVAHQDGTVTEPLKIVSLLSGLVIQTDLPINEKTEKKIAELAKHIKDRSNI